MPKKKQQPKFIAEFSNGKCTFCYAYGPVSEVNLCKKCDDHLFNAHGIKF